MVKVKVVEMWWCCSEDEGDGGGDVVKVKVMLVEMWCSKNDRSQFHRRTPRFSVDPGTRYFEPTLDKAQL